MPLRYSSRKMMFYSCNISYLDAMDFFNDLQDFFATMTRQEMLFFWVVAGLLFLIGLLIGLLIRGRGLNYYKKQYLLSEKERVDLSSKATIAEERQKALEKEVTTLSQEKVAAIDRCQELEAITSGGSSTELSALRDQIQLLQSENADLRNRHAVNPASLSPDADVKDYLEAAEARFQAFEQRLAEISEENLRLRTELGQPKDKGISTPAASNPSQPYGKPHEPIIGNNAAVQENDTEPLVIRADTTNPGVRSDGDGGMEVIVDTTPSLIVPVIPPDGLTPDDLQQIRNIGPFLEKKLNEAGIFTYQQIANWSAEDSQRISAEIGYLPGIVERDDWVGQAKHLLHATNASKDAEMTPSAAQPAGTPALIDQSNLQVVEGVGPKIESILKAADINTLADLANSNPEALSAILADAGSHYKSHNPDTWPLQAQLANAGKLNELKAFQDSM